MSLRNVAISAGRWTAISAAFRTGLQILQTMVLARLLLPGDYGLMAMVMSIMAVITLFSDLGVSRALIHFDEANEEALSTLYWLNLGMAFLLMLGVGMVASFVAVMYKSPQLVPVLQLAALSLPLSALGQQFRVLAEKHLRFRPLARNEMASAMLGFVVAIAGALMGLGVYALVLGLLCNAALSSMFAWIWLSEGTRPGLRFKLLSAKPYLTFGSIQVGDNFLITLNRQADIFVGGLVAAPSALGLFSVPRDLGLRIANMINPTLTRVGFPVMARARHDRTRLHSIYLQSLRLTASINFPIYLALAVFAPEVVSILYGPRWHGAAPFLQIFAIWGLIRSTANPVGSLIYAVGRPSLSFWWNVAILIVTPLVLLAAASQGSLVTMAWAMVGLQACFVIPVWFWLVRPLCDASLGEYLGQFIVPLFLAALAAGAAIGAATIATGNIARLIVGCGVGALVYLAASARFNAPFALAMRDALRPASRRNA